MSHEIGKCPMHAAGCWPQLCFWPPGRALALSVGKLIPIILRATPFGSAGSEEAWLTGPELGTIPLRLGHCTGVTGQQASFHPGVRRQEGTSPWVSPGTRARPPEAPSLNH